jgi:tRNA threonylcarbamoyladenosine biosynthesis protein TsaE
LSDAQIHETRSVEGTLALAAQVAATLREGDVVWLHGDLGAGKTHFVKGLARGLGIDEDAVRSPTFTFIDVHRTRGEGLSLVHVDLYRIGGPSELRELGLEDLPGPRSVAAVEWAERLPAGVLEATHVVRMDDLGGDLRRIGVTRR